MSVKGEYYFKIPIMSMFLNTHLIIKGSNLITTLGESFFLRRCIDNDLNPIEYIVVGNGVNIPTKKDLTLGNETRRETVVKNVDLINKRLVLTCRIPVQELIGITEIGVVNTTSDAKEEILISHDVFKETVLSEDFLYGVIGEVQVDYVFQFTTSQIKSGWEKAVKSNNVFYDNVYYVYEPNEIMFVIDNTNGNGIRKVSSVQSVENTKDSYFHDVTSTNNIYIHLTHRDDELSPNPNSHEIVIQNK